MDAASKVFTKEPEMNNAFERLLSQSHKGFFSSYVHLEPGFRNEFYYQNSTSVPEEVAAVFFHADGTRVHQIARVQARIKPAEAITIDAAKLLSEAGFSSFSGSIMFVLHPEEAVVGDDIGQRDFVCYWESPQGPHGAHISIGALKELNVTGKKEHKTYNLFCPAIVSSPDIKTLIVAFNHSTEPNYKDRVTIHPILSNLKGKKLEGKELTVGPLGLFLIDVDEVFGEGGKKLLSETDGRGTVTVVHTGQQFITLFFHIDKKTNAIVSGTHTSPASTIPYSYGVTQPVLTLLAEKTPLMYWLWSLKRFFQG